MFKLKEFAASINTKGVLKNNKYMAIISLSGNHYLSSQFNQGDEQLFSIRCDSVQLPGVAIASADGPPRLGYGPIEKHPYNANFEDVSLTFIVDANSQVHRMLYSWVNVIVNFGKSSGMSNLFEKTGAMNAAAYEVGYRNRYATDMKIEVYRDTGGDKHEKTMTYTLFKAFPMAFPSAGLNWNEGDILKLNIPFAYTDFTVDYSSYNDTPNSRLPTETGIVDQQVATGAPGIAQIIPGVTVGNRTLR